MGELPSAELHTLERERERLERLLMLDANWRALQQLEAREASGEPVLAVDGMLLRQRLVAVLETNRIYVARAKLIEALELLSGEGPAPVAALASRIVLLEPSQSSGARRSPLAAAVPPTLAASATDGPPDRQVSPAVEGADERAAPCGPSPRAGGPSPAEVRMLAEDIGLIDGLDGWTEQDAELISRLEGEATAALWQEPVRIIPADQPDPIASAPAPDAAPDAPARSPVRVTPGRTRLPEARGLVRPGAADASEHGRGAREDVGRGDEALDHEAFGPEFESDVEIVVPGAGRAMPRTDAGRPPSVSVAQREPGRIRHLPAARAGAIESEDAANAEADAEVVIITRRDSPPPRAVVRPRPGGGRNSLLHRLRNARDRASFDADAYAAYRTDIEEASVTIVHAAGGHGTAAGDGPATAPRQVGGPASALAKTGKP